MNLTLKCNRGYAGLACVLTRERGMFLHPLDPQPPPPPTHAHAHTAEALALPEGGLKSRHRERVPAESGLALFPDLKYIAGPAN